MTIYQKVLAYAENINLIYSAEECEHCKTPTILEERDRRKNFIKGLESIDEISKSPEVVAALICFFVDFLDTESGFDGFANFYNSIYFDILKLLK